MKRSVLVLIGLVFVCACSASPTVVPKPTETIQVVAAAETFTPVPSPELRASPTTQVTPTPVPVPSTLIPTPKLEPSHVLGPAIREEPGPFYDTMLQIPVAENGILYRGAGVEDMDPVGPNGLVVTSDSVFIIGDVFGNRLLRYDASMNRLQDIDLTSLDILNISDLVGAGDALYILEVSFKVLPERYRVNQLTTDGKLVNQYDLPKGFHLEDGLYGLAVGTTTEGEAQVLVQLGAGAGSHYFRVPDAAEKRPEALRVLPVYGKDLQLESAGPGELAVLRIGEQTFESPMTSGGIIYLLFAGADGGLYLQREDLVTWNPMITTDLTIHYITPDGRPIGVARYPLMDWYFHLWRFLTVGPDGNVYGLITREESVDILRLNFYRHLDPIQPEAVEPVVTHPSLDLSVDQVYDCSAVRHMEPGSAEAQLIVQEFLANFHQDWSTEYMEFEELWAVDRLGDYAVIQARVTQEEKDILVVQETQRGFVMVTRYHSLMVLSGKKYKAIPEYLAGQLPDASPELFYCLDLSRYNP